MTNKYIKIHNLRFDKAIKRWDEAIPLGNGKLGCLVWGDGDPLKLSLDRNDLWDMRQADETMASDFKYSEIIKLINGGEKNHDEHNKRFDACYNHHTPTKIPAGRIELAYENDTNHITSSLNLADAVAKVEIDFSGKTSTIETYLHATNFTGFVKITGLIPEINLMSPRYAKESDSDNFEAPGNEPAKNGLLLLGYPKSESYADNEFIWFHQKTKTDFEYAIIIAYKKTETELEFTYTITTNKDGDNWFEDAKKIVKELLLSGFHEALFSHTQWWRSFWDKSEISIPDKELEKQYYLSNYFLGSASRKGFFPMPLQGVWTADNDDLPPWKGDYHHDLNTQMTYWSYMKANHMEEGEVFIDFLLKIIPKARAVAKEFYETDGIIIPAVSTIDGGILGGWPPYSLNIVNQIWLCQAFDHYYLYTGDLEFLSEKAYPFFKESANAISKLLVVDNNGKLKLPLSSSPEVYDNSFKAYQKPNTNNDLALLIYLFKTLKEYSITLQNDDTEIWSSFLQNLDEIAISKDNIIMMSSVELLPESHRHHGHMMCVYPLHIMNYDSPKNRRIIDESITYLEILGTGWWVGFSFVWMSNFYAKQLNGEGAWYQLKLFYENCVSQNGFHLNGDFKKRGISYFHYRPFTLEANFGYADAMQEMLLQNSDNMLCLFPAIPEHWAKKGVSFKNLRSYNGVLVSCEIEDNKIKRCDLTTNRPTRQKIKNSFNKEILTVITEEKSYDIICPINENFEIVIDGKCAII